MADLVSYVAEQIKRGYDVSTIRQYLLSYGYAPDVVEDALRRAYSSAYSQKPKKAFKLEGIWLYSLIIVAVLIVMVSLFFVFLFKPGGPGNTNDAGMEEPKQNTPGLVSSPVSSPGKPVQSPAPLQSPSQPAKTAAKPNCNDGLKNQGEAKPDCGGPCKACAAERPYDPGGVGYKTEDIPGFRPGIVDSGLLNDSKTGLEFLNEIKAQAKKDPVAASKGCPALREILQDDCYKYIAENSNQSIYCALVKAEKERDACYVTFTLEGNYEVCDKLSSEVMKSTCYSLRDISRSGGLATGKAYALIALLISLKDSGST